MKIKIQLFAISLLLLAALGLSACERSASAPPVPDAGEGYPIVEGTKPPMEALEEISTLTAIAKSGGAVVAGESSAEGGVVEEDSKPTSTPQPPSAPTQQPAAKEQSAESQNQPEEVDLNFPVPDTYTLQSGEFPFCIARRFDIAPETLMAVNGLSSSSVTYPGTVLKIPKDSPHFNLGNRALRQHPTTYTVQPGDTVNSIACLFGDVDPRAIEAVNGFKGAYSLKVGQTIQIP